MQANIIQRVVEELRTTLPGRYFGKIFQLTPLSFAIDFGLRGEFLFISVDPASPRIYLIRRRTKDLEKQSIPLSGFGLAMRSKLSGGHVINISKDPSDRIVRLTFRLEDAIFRRLIIQLTGRTADLFIADELNRIEAVLREDPQIRFQKIYEPPTRDKPRTSQEGRLAPALGPGFPSAQLDAYFTAQDAARRFDSRAKATRGKLTKSIRQQRTLREHLEQDLERHGDANTHKRIGDLLLANIATAQRQGNKVLKCC